MAFSISYKLNYVNLYVIIKGHFADEKTIVGKGGLVMKKTFSAALLICAVITTGAHASTTHKVIKGDTMWKISVKYEQGLSEVIGANPQIENPALIYPGQLVNIPEEDAGVSSFETEVVRLVNNIRKQNGLKELTHNWQLSRVARYKSQDMADKNYFSHTSPTYGSPFQMSLSFGISYRTAGENIAKGQRTPEAVVNAWMNSAGHKANILSSSYKEIGVGYVKNGNIWTQMFIG